MCFPPSDAPAPGLASGVGLGVEDNGDFSAGEATFHWLNRSLLSNS